ncbi:MAG: ArsA-related P-loop ATPase [Nitriliruptorales bacterium]|nr:ArsA-related P-loop ATPase [Nitriliruptorales bacterium]
MSGDTLADARGASLAEAVERAEILVTTGAGGVGKTTTAAALGVAAADAGREALVLTIDPARRLAQAMGLDELASEPQSVTLDADSPGSLDAMMLDMESTFDSLIDRYAASPERARAIRSNRIYQTLSSTLSGTQEYMAMEKLHELHDRGLWDLLIIDTPPTRNALDFLEAPKRMTSFLEGRLLRLLMKPGIAAGKSYLRAVNFGATAFMRMAGKVTGMELLNDLGDFFRNFEGMYEGFKERAEEVLELLQRPTSQFVVVASPQPPPLREAKFFVERLQQEGLHAAGVVVNRIHPEAASAPPPDVLREAARAQADDREGRAVAGALHLLADVKGVAERERRDVAAALFGLRFPALVEVPLLRGDIHDLDGLQQVSKRLVGGSEGQDVPAGTRDVVG